MDLSVVIPCYRSANTIATVVADMEALFAERPEMSYEIILVNDCSPDNTYEVIKKLVSEDEHIIGVDIAKNRGQQSAIMAGLRQSIGNLVMVSDDDGQTPVKEIGLQMIDKIDEGYDIVCANYVSRGKRSLFRRLGTAASHWLTKNLLEKPDEISASAFFVAKRFAVDEMVKYENPYPYILGQMLLTTHNIGEIEIEQKSRIAGESGYNFKRLMSLWVTGATTFSIKPLRLATIVGSILATLGFLLIIVLVILKLTTNNMAIGWTSLISTNILIGGLIMMMLGVIGEYIGRIYLSINNNPQYVVREVIGEGRQSGTNKSDAKK